MKKLVVLFITFGTLLSFILGCAGNGESNSFELPSTTPPVTTNPPDPLAGSPLYLNFSLRWEAGSATEEASPYTSFDKNCAIAPLAPNGTIRNCTINVPEAQLFYSDIKFGIGTKVPGNCPIIRFFPYYYRRSVDQNFTDPKSGNTFDCRRAADGGPATDQKECYGGAAPTMITGFPTYAGLYYLTGVTNEFGPKIEASNALLYYGPSLVNYLVTNDLAVPARSTQVASGPNARAGDESGVVDWTDYKVTCENAWGERIYTLNLTLGDENEDNNATGAADEYPDWQ